MKIDWEFFFTMLIGGCCFLLWLIGFVACIELEDSRFLLLWIPAIIGCMLLMAKK